MRNANMSGFEGWIKKQSLLELTDIGSIDTSAVDLKPMGRDRDDPFSDGFVHRFEYRRKNYVVFMARKESSVVDGVSLVDPVVQYAITFKGPRGTYLTGEEGPAAVAIYTRMLAAIKRLIENERVDALVFSAQQREMLPLYERFIGNFLSGSFSQLTDNSYLRKEILDSELGKMSPEERSDLERSISLSIRGKREEIDSVRREKIAMRGLRRNKAGVVGKITGYRVPMSLSVSPAVIMDVGLDHVRALVVTGSMDLDHAEVVVEPKDFHRFSDPMNIDDQTMSEFRVEVARGQTDLARRVKTIPGFDWGTYSFGMSNKNATPPKTPEVRGPSLVSRLKSNIGDFFVKPPF